MKLPLTLTLLLTFVMFFSFSDIMEASASDKTIPSVSVTPDFNSIDVQWNFKGDLFKIIDNKGDIIYNGDQNSYKLVDLESNSLVSFYIVAYNDGNITNSQHIITTTLKNTNKLNMRTLASSTEIDTSITSIASSEGVNLDWNDIPGVEEYRVFRNQELIATISDSNYTDVSIVKNSTYTYEIEFSIPLSDSEKVETKNFLSDNELLDLSDKEIEQMSQSRPVSIIRIVDTTPPSLPIQPLATPTTSFSWVYKTFLPMDYIEDPIPLNGIAFFGGDNRTFSFDSEKYRTKMWGKTVFSYDSTHDFSKNVGKTTAYDDNKKLISSKTASDELMYGVKNTHTYTKADYTYYHKVGNPYIPISGHEIDILMRVVTNSNGTYSFEGKHDRAPSHELYLTLNNGVSNRQIFAHPNEGLGYLGGPSTLARSFSITGSL
ncbi:hypothetical protein [Lysinibacillus sp. FSL M8-0134]|uniref:hypothetical protein n=1 Tax=Lysinibacillus sp. FSL M8-0134 TaxID=2921717 RepID=UPI00311A7B27